MAGSRFDKVLAVLLAIALAVLLGAAAIQRAPWYDEFFTAFVTRPDLPLREAVWQHWMVDNHPPLYYAMVRLAAVLTTTLEALRGINLAFAALVAGLGAVALRQAGARAGFGWLGLAFLVALAGQPVLADQASQLRSYFASTCALALLALALVLEWTTPDDAPRARWLLPLASVLACNLHVVTTVAALALLGVFAGGALRRKRRKTTMRLMIAGLVGAGIFAATSALQIPLWEANTRQFWIDGGWRPTYWTVLKLFTSVTLGTPAIALAAAAGFAAQGWRAARSRTLPPMLEAAALLLAGIALTLLALFALHLLWRPILIGRYVAPLAAPGAMILALGLTGLPGIGDSRWRGAAMAALSIAALWSQYQAVQRALARPGWSGTAAALSKRLDACSESPVHIDPQWNADILALPPADNARALGWAYAIMAKRYDILVEPPESRRRSGRCPTLFWAEHATALRPTAAAVLAAERARGFTISRLTLVRIGDGWIAIAY